MRDWAPERIAEAAGARLIAAGRPAGDGGPGGPGAVVIDSREAGPGAARLLSRLCLLAVVDHAVDIFGVGHLVQVRHHRVIK